MSIEIGEFVTASYKTGRYVGEVVDQKPTQQKSVVKILAVLVHPKQGDLHAPNKVDVQMFHERRALANTEKALVPWTSVKPFQGKIPDYGKSLLKSVLVQLEKLAEDDSDYAELASKRLEDLLKDYQRTYN